MILKNTYFGFFLFILFISACSLFTKNQNENSNSEKYKIIAVDKYAADIRYTFNNSKDFVVCINEQKKSVAQGDQSIKFFIYDIKTDKILHEDSMATGKIQWINDRQVKVVQFPGIIRGDSAGPETVEYIFDVQSLKKLPGGKIENKNL